MSTPSSSDKVSDRFGSGRAGAGGRSRLHRFFNITGLKFFIVLICVICFWLALAGLMEIRGDARLVNGYLSESHVDLSWWDVTRVYADDGGLGPDPWTKRSYLLPDGYSGLQHCGNGKFGPVRKVTFLDEDTRPVNGCKYRRAILTDRMFIIDW